MWSANAFDFEQSKNLSFGKELIALKDDVNQFCPGGACQGLEFCEKCEKL